MQEVKTSGGEYLSVGEAARIIGCSVNALYLAIERKEIPGVLRIGRKIRIRRAAILPPIGH